jgi:OmpA-OmpF porin, OOP family
MKSISRFTAAAAMLLLAGCTSNIQAIKTAPATGSPFTQGLAAGYRDYTDTEVSFYNWPNADYFARKGLRAAAGEAVPPEQLADWDIPADRQAELAAARQRLAGDLDGGARDAKPQLAAKAQVSFDCWVEEQDIALGRWVDGHDDLHQARMDACKNALMTALDEIEKKQTSSAQPSVVSPANYTVYFDFDKSTITPAGQGVIDHVLAEAKSMNAQSLSVTGHTDLAGTADYNMALSLRRADVVRSALVTGGVPADLITVAGRGMSEPAVPTAPGVREPRNRRVEIILQP